MVAGRDWPLAGDIQGVVQGFSGSVASLGSILELVLGGVLYAGIGNRTFLVSAAITGLVVLLALRFVGER